MCKVVASSYYQYLLDDICETISDTSLSHVQERFLNLGLITEFNKEEFRQPKCKMTIEKFHDGEVCITFKESLRGTHLFIVGETSHNLTETLLIIDAARRNAVKEITVILPYYGYSRQDKKEEKRSCIGSKMIAHVLESMKVDRVVTIDLHAEQIQGFFDITVDHIIGRSIFVEQLKSLIDINPDTSILCSPDAGGYKRVDKFCKVLKIPMVSINKRRDKPGSVEWMELVGDVKNKHVFLIDDIMDSGGTILKANELLLSEGAASVTNMISHMVLSNPSILFKFAEKGIKLYTTNTLNYYNEFLKTLPINERELLKNTVRVFNCGPLLGNAVLQIANAGSVTSINEGKFQ